MRFSSSHLQPSEMILFFCAMVFPTLKCKVVAGALFWSPHSPAPSQAPDTQETLSKHLCSKGTCTALPWGTNGAVQTQRYRENLHSRGTARTQKRDNSLCPKPGAGCKRKCPA